MPTLVPLEDKDIGKELGRSFTRRGMTVKTNAKLIVDSVNSGENSVSVDIEVSGKRESLEADMLLVAVGRTGNTEDIGLESIGVNTERGVIPVDGYGRTNVPHVYAVGDVAGGYLLAHKATAEGHVAVEHLAGEEPYPLDPLRVPRATYCRPEIASIGLLEEEAVEQGREVKVGRFPFAALGKALIKGQTEGFVKMVCDAKTAKSWAHTSSARTPRTLSLRWAWPNCWKQHLWKSASISIPIPRLRRRSWRPPGT